MVLDYGGRKEAVKREHERVLRIFAQGFLCYLKGAPVGLPPHEDAYLFDIDKGRFYFALNLARFPCLVHFSHRGIIILYR